MRTNVLQRLSGGGDNLDQAYHPRPVTWAGQQVVSFFHIIPNTGLRRRGAGNSSIVSTIAAKAPPPVDVVTRSTVTLRSEKIQFLGTDETPRADLIEIYPLIGRAKPIHTGSSVDCDVAVITNGAPACPPLCTGRGCIRTGRASV